MSGIKRRFRIWQCPKNPWCWQWECTLCDPPAHGGRHGPDAWAKILTVSLPGHMRRRYYHHRHVAGRR